MKRLKQVFLAASVATLLISGSIGFAKAATKEDISYLIKETKKTECIKEYEDGVRRKALSDREKIGDEEKNIYFGINYREFQNEAYVKDVLIIIDYIKHEDNRLDIKQMVIKDGYGQPDGQPDVVKEARVFETLEKVKYIDDDGVEKVGEVALVDDWFPLMYELEGSQEKERINKIFDKVVELFKLKIKKTPTPKEIKNYHSIKQEIEQLVLESEYLHKTRNELDQAYRN